MSTKYSFQQNALPSVTDEEKEKGRAEDVVIEVKEPQRTRPYAGMSPEDVDRFANTPFWNTFRRITLGLFFLLWFSLFVVSIALIVIYPRCAKRPEQKWWQRSTYYQVFVPSFQDSDGDGIGDLRGLESRLPKLQFLGVDAVVISSIFRQSGTPIERFADDLVTDFDQIDARLGNMSDVTALVASARSKGIRLVLEFPLNHVGRNHPWFRASAMNDPKFSNFFVWSPQLPNNWTSRSGASAWTKDSGKNAWFYHSGAADQPDLNWRSSQLRELLTGSLLKWLDQGFDGALVTQATRLFEDYELRDEPANKKGIFTADLPETIDALRRLRSAIHANNSSKMLMVDINSSPESLSRYVALDGTPVSDVPVSCHSRALLEVPDCDAKCLWSAITDLQSLQAPFWPVNLLGHRQSEKRLVEVREKPNLALMLYSVLPGSLFTYYGDEIGLNSTLAPMRWSNASRGGFTRPSTSPWTPQEDGDFFDHAREQRNSSIRLLKSLQELRRGNPALQIGRTHLVLAQGPVLGVRREFDGVKSFFVLINFGRDSYSAEQLGLGKMPGIPGRMELVLDSLWNKDITAEEASFKTEEVGVEAGQARLFSWDYAIKEHL